ncbi:MAG TPA: hypothetical protein VKS79_08295 [Gemmataceae bacterium]|nr:hypothetical protein [Gemmataceae bacterium]
MQRHFFATADDLIPVFERAEKKQPLVYTLAGLFDSTELIHANSGADLPSLHQPAPHEGAIGCPHYVVVPRELSVQIREVPQRAGGIKYAVDQLINPDSIIVSHGGLREPNALLSGNVGTCTGSKISVSLYRSFSYAIGKQFVRVRSFWVGPEAYRLFMNGWRLTTDVDRPREYDLAEEKE